MIDKIVNDVDGVSVESLLSFADNHYITIYFKVIKGSSINSTAASDKNAVKSSKSSSIKHTTGNQQVYISACHTCPFTDHVIVDEGKKMTADDFKDRECPECNSIMHVRKVM